MASGFQSQVTAFVIRFICWTLGWMESSWINKYIEKEHKGHRKKKKWQIFSKENFKLIETWKYRTRRCSTKRSIDVFEFTFGYIKSSEWNGVFFSICNVIYGAKKKQNKSCVRMQTKTNPINNSNQKFYVFVFQFIIIYIA